MATDDDIVGPINLGNPGEFTILELAQLVQELSGSKCPIEHKPAPPDDPHRRQPDITRARKHLNWEPQVPLREGLKKTVEWFQSIDIDQYRAPTPNY